MNQKKVRKRDLTHTEEKLLKAN